MLLLRLLLLFSLLPPFLLILLHLLDILLLLLLLLFLLLLLLFLVLLLPWPLAVLVLHLIWYSVRFYIRKFAFPKASEFFRSLKSPESEENLQEVEPE